MLKAQTVLKEREESSPSAMNSIALTIEPRRVLTQTSNRMEKKIYITPRGARQLREELAYLWRDKRPLVTEQVRAAAALGDRSENAEYQYGKRQLREIDRRIRYLQKRLENLSVVDRIPSDRDRVFSALSLRFAQKATRSCRFVSWVKTRSTWTINGLA